MKVLESLKGIFGKRPPTKLVKNYTREERETAYKQGELADKLLKNTNFNEFVELFYLENTLKQDRMKQADGETHSDFQSRVSAAGYKRVGAFEFRDYLKSFVVKATEVKASVIKKNNKEK